MTFEIVSICLDGMPFLPIQFAAFNRLKLDWHWTICEGVAENIKDTSWCARIQERLSKDGSTEFLNAIKSHPRISVFQKPLWPGKTAMLNIALSRITHPCFLLEVDVDEVWTTEQLHAMFDLMQKGYDCARFFMRYFVGPNIITVGDNGYGNSPGIWLRLWNRPVGVFFDSHEPPVLHGINEPTRQHGTNQAANEASREMTRSLGLIADHYSYAFEHQLRFKEEYYKYPDATARWKRLQAHPGPWPVKLNAFFPWVDDVLVDQLP